MSPFQRQQRIEAKTRKRVFDNDIDVSAKLSLRQISSSPRSSSSLLDEIPCHTSKLRPDATEFAHSTNVISQVPPGQSQQTNIDDLSSSNTDTSVFDSDNDLQTANTTFITNPTPNSSDSINESEQRSKLANQSRSTLVSSSPARVPVHWPTLPESYNCAPWFIQWESARLANICGLDLESEDINYTSISDWGSHNNVLKRFRSRCNLKPAQIPASSEDAWKACLSNGGQYKNKKSVVFSGELKRNHGNHGPLFEFVLNPLKMEISHRLERQFGADRLLELTVPSEIPPNECVFGGRRQPRIKTIDWLYNTEHYLLGRRWQVFFVKDVNEKRKIKVANSDLQTKPKVERKRRLFLFAVDGADLHHSRKNRPCSIEDFMRWTINIDSNRQQSVAKLFSRFALSLTRATPTAVLERREIRIGLPDLKSPTGEIMHDGIGRMSITLGRRIANLLDIHPTPSAFQGRIGSAKGVWIIDTSDTSEETWIDIYDSQIKWKCDFIDDHHRTFEVKTYSKALKSGELTHQFIPVLEDRAIDANRMRDVIANRLQESLMSEFEINNGIEINILLLEWITQNMRTEASPSGNTENVAYCGSLPLSLEDQAILLLQSGFCVKKSRHLHNLITKIVDFKSAELEQKMRVRIPCSTNVLIVADFTGTLEENEVHLSFSNTFEAEGFYDTNLEGMDVLVARSPCHLPSDIQRVRAVSRQALRQHKDVLVFSTKGNSPLAASLSGGDYDGDTAWICWDKEIVNNFNSVPVPSRPRILSNFQLSKDTTTVNDVFKTHEDGYTEFLRHALEFNSKPSLLGVCTKEKEQRCYLLGSISRPEALAMSFLLSDLVDQNKQGIIFAQEHWNRFKNLVLGTNSKNLPSPEYWGQQSDTRISRSNGAKMHILDYLICHVGPMALKQSKYRFFEHIKPSESAIDDDLTRLYREVDNKRQQSKSLHAVLLQLSRDLDEIVELCNRTTSTRQLCHEKWLDIQPLAAYTADPEIIRLSQPWINDRHMTEWSLLKASYLFYKRGKWGSARVWDIAGRQLCALKILARQTSIGASPVAIVPDIYPYLKIDKRRLKKLKTKSCNQD